MPGDRDSESDDLFDEEEKHEVSTDSLDVSTKEKEQETFRELRVDLARLGVDTVERLTRKKNKDGNLKESEKTRDQQVEVSTKQRTVTSKYILKEHSYSILSYAIKENIAANSGHLLKIYWEVTKNGTEFKEGWEQWYETYGHDIPGEHLSNYVYYLLNNSLISPFVLQTIWSAVAAKLPADKERPECPSFLPPRLSGHELIKRHFRDDPENEQGTSEATTAAQDTQDETAATDANTEDDKSLFETIVLDDTQDDVTAEDPVIVMGIGLENVVPIVDDCSSPVQSYTSTVSDSENIEEINEDAIETIIIEDDGNENESSFPVINIDDSPSEASIIETCNNTLQNVSKDSPIQAQTEETITVYGQVDGKDAVVTSNNYITKPQSIAKSLGKIHVGEYSESNLDKGPSDDSALYTTSVKAGKSTSSKPTEMPESVTELIELPRCSEDLRAGRPKHQIGEECRVTPVLEIVSEEEFENCIIEIDPSDDVADDLQNGYYTCNCKYFQSTDLPNAENEDGAVTVFHNQAVGVADLESQSTILESYGQVTNSVNQCDTGNDELIAVAGKQASISKKSAETATVRNQGQEMLGYALDSPSSTGGANKLTEETDLRNDVIQIGSDSGDSEDEYDISKPPTRVPTYKEYLENLKLLRIYTESILKGAVTNDSNVVDSNT
ncbi:hypothetical protein NQ315_003005 [Exocentrus adspersus]|uniref:Uncharacterized protein n=1 Tax=Exocentrus adspersus TaxID=1586481 RepID=A0AAV8W4W7_9CUCU|nr:hypothetical protein NQ315_003005 [Exocentrus adspersus]